MGARLKLEQVKTVLDVGCGIGHWGQLLAPVLHPDTRMIGIDREESHLVRASKRATEQGLSHRYSYQPGDATSLPFPDGTFDMVTCQTVLIHLKDPKLGLREMLRVLKPGGILLAVEPNNFANHAVFSSITERLSVDEVIDRLKFDLFIQRGKKALGLGFNSEGDLVPGYLSELDADDIQVHTSDKASPFFSPYSRPDQQANIRQMRDWAKRKFLGWDRDEMEKYFIAGGGGEPDRFEYYWDQRLKNALEVIKAIDEGTYHSAGGGISYLISARKKINS